MTAPRETEMVEIQVGVEAFDWIEDRANARGLTHDEVILALIALWDRS